MNQLQLDLTLAEMDKLLEKSLLEIFSGVASMFVCFCSSRNKTKVLIIIYYAFVTLQQLTDLLAMATRAAKRSCTRPATSNGTSKM